MIDISLTLTFLHVHIRYTATMYIIAYYIIAAKCTSSPKMLNITTTKPQGGTHLSTYTLKYWLCTCKWETPSGKSRVSWNLGGKMLKRLVRIISTTCGGYNYLDRKLPIWSQWGQRNHVWWQVSILIPALWPGLNNSKNTPKHQMSESFLVWCSDHCCTFLPSIPQPQWRMIDFIHPNHS